MNHISLFLEEYKNNDKLYKDGLLFHDIIVIKLLIDGEAIEDNEYFDDALIYFNELKASTVYSGKYLIFTCACGVAEDGGWEGVNVEVEEHKIKWCMEVGGKIFRYVFNKSEYISEVKAIEISINNTNLILEPSAVVFPERFSR